MIKDKETIKSRFYLRFTIIILVLFFFILLLITLFVGLFLLTPIGKIAINAAGGAIIIFFLASYLVATLISLFLSYFYIKKVFYPLVDLSSKSMKVATGDFSVSVEEDAILPELKETQKSFNIMIKELSKVETLSNAFVSNVSHEFKTPLSIIRSNVNILQNTELSEEEKKNCLKIINDSTEKLATLVSNVLRICKLDNQEVVLNRTVYRLDEQIRQSILMYNNLLEEKNIELDLKLDTCLINSDKELLAHVWNNLISNAIKFSYDNEKITIILNDEKEETIVIIKDNGVGMDEDTKKHIFDRFYQGDTSHANEGNGLGLTIVSKILNICQGTINVESEIGKGSTFIINIKKFK